MRRFAVIAAALILSDPALAFDHADRTTLDAALQRFGADLEAERLTQVNAAIPPAIYRMLKERSGETEAAMRARLIDLETGRLGDADIIDVTFDTSRVTIATSADGWDYAVVPTSITASQGLGSDTTTNTQTFALQDTGTWYFFRMKDRSDVELIQNAYPDFADIDLPDPKDMP